MKKCGYIYKLFLVVSVIFFSYGCYSTGLEGDRAPSTGNQAIFIVDGTEITIENGDTDVPEDVEAIETPYQLEIDPESITDDTVEFERGDGTSTDPCETNERMSRVAEVVNQRTLRVTPNESLVQGRNYALRINRSSETSTRMRSTDGTVFESSELCFKVRVTDPPIITTLVPEDGATGVAINIDVEATFDMAMNSSSINETTFTLESAGGDVAGVVTYDSTSMTATFDPDSNLDSFTEYTATIASTVESRAGVELGTDEVWTFRTSDVVAPTATLDPANGAITVDIGTDVVATFSEDINCDTVDPTSFTLSGGAVLDHISCADNIATFVTAADLSYRTSYTATLTTDIEDLNGNPLASDETATWTTQWRLGAQTLGASGNDDARSVRQTADNGYLFAGSLTAASRDYWVVKLDQYGEVERERRYGGGGTDQLNSMELTSDGGSIVAGYTNSFGAGNDDGWVIKLDSDGNVDWDYTYGTANRDRIRSVIQTADGGYAYAGYYDTSSGGWVLKTDLTGGNITWQRQYNPTAFGEDLYQIKQTTDGGYIVVGSYPNGGVDDDVWLMKLNSDGTIAWQKRYGGGDADDGYAVIEASDGDFVVAAGTQSFGAGGTDMWIFKVDSNGDFTGGTWQKTYGGTSTDQPYDIIEAADGDFVVAGFTGSYGPGSNNYWILKLNPGDGSIDWQKVYGGDNGDVAYSVSETSDNGFAVGGSTFSFDVDFNDAWILKLDSGGNIGSSCSAESDSSTVPADTAIAGVNTASTSPATAVAPAAQAESVFDTFATPDTQCSVE